MTTNTKLFLDDERFPPDDGAQWTIVRTFEQAVDWVQTYGCPSFISFDNDLGVDEQGNNRLEGWHFARWLVEYDLDNNVIPDNFEFYVHSQNVAGKQAIQSRLENYLKFKFDQSTNKI